MARSPNVSIVVCTYNRAMSLRLTLDALAAQLTPPDVAWELVVVDNNSTDATREVIGDFARSARFPVQSVHVAEQGVSHARNAGVARSAGDIVGFTDDDVHPAPDWVARISAVMGRRGPDIVGGRILPAWQQPPPQWLVHRAFVHGALAIMDRETHAEVLHPHGMLSVWGANMAFRREVFDEVGLFDTRRGRIGTLLYCGEEVDLVARALAAGYRAVYDPTLVVWHRIGADRMRVGYLSRLSFQRAEGEALVQAPVNGRALFGVPLYRYRSLVHLMRFLLVAAARRRSDTVDRWFELCAALGFTWGLCKRWFRKGPTVR